jgi:hypothetical protein
MAQHAILSGVAKTMEKYVIPIFDSWDITTYWDL